MVDLLVDEVHAHSRHLHTPLEGVADGVRPLEGGQQCGVDVQPAAGERVRERPPKDPHVSGAHRDVDPAGKQCVAHGLGIGVSVGVVAQLKNHRFDAGPFGSLEREDPRPVGEHQRDPRADRRIVEQGL